MATQTYQDDLSDYAPLFYPKSDEESTGSQVSPFTPSTAAYDKYSQDRLNPPQEGPISAKKRLLGVLLAGAAGGSQYANRTPGAAEQLGSQVASNYVHGPFNAAMASYQNRLKTEQGAAEHEQQQNVFGLNQYKAQSEDAFRQGELGINRKREENDAIKAEVDLERARRAPKESPEHFLSEDQAVVDSFLNPDKYAGVAGGPEGFRSSITKMHNQMHPTQPTMPFQPFVMSGPTGPTLMNYNRKGGTVTPTPGAEGVAPASATEAAQREFDSRLQAAQKDIHAYQDQAMIFDPSAMSPEQKQFVQGIYQRYGIGFDPQGQFRDMKQQGPQAGSQGGAGTQDLGPAPQGSPEGRTGTLNGRRVIVRGGRLVAQ